ncbi:unnamed protein product, partial [Iphiclides podalirius]
MTTVACKRHVNTWIRRQKDTFIREPAEKSLSNKGNQKLSAYCGHVAGTPPAAIRDVATLNSDTGALTSVRSDTSHDTTPTRSGRRVSHRADSTALCSPEYILNEPMEPMTS